MYINILSFVRSFFMGKSIFPRLSGETFRLSLSMFMYRRDSGMREEMRLAWVASGGGKQRL